MTSDSNTSNSLFLGSHTTHAPLRDVDSIKSSDVYDCYLQADNYDDDFQDLNDFDDFEDDNFFESSQIHQLIHTQPVHLINQQTYISNLPVREETVQIENERTTKRGEPPLISPTMTSRSSSMSTTFSKRASIYETCFENVDESMDREYEDSIIDGKDQNTMLYSAFYNIYNRNTDEQYQNSRVPRNFSCEETETAVYFDPHHTDEDQLAYTVGKSYHYSVQTSNPKQSCYAGDGEALHYANDEGIQFTKAVVSKLSRYAGYFTAGSKDQEYSDKVRFQEISYKFSKTYF